MSLGNDEIHVSKHQYFSKFVSTEGVPVVITVLGVSPTHPLLSRHSKYVSHDKTGVILGIAESLPTYAILIAHGLSLQSLNWRVIRVDPIQVLQ